jgi:hypothetical protein
VFYNIVTLGCANVVPILGGWISNKYNFQMQFKILIGFTGLALLAIIFACPEHAYVRPSIYETDMASTEGVAIVNEKNAEIATAVETTPPGTTGEDASKPAAETAPENGSTAANSTSTEYQRLTGRNSNLSAAASAIRTSWSYSPAPLPAFSTQLSSGVSQSKDSGHPGPLASLLYSPKSSAAHPISSIPPNLVFSSYSPSFSSSLAASLVSSSLTGGRNGVHAATMEFLSLNSVSFSLFPSC